MLSHLQWLLVCGTSFSCGSPFRVCSKRKQIQRREPPRTIQINEGTDKSTVEAVKNEEQPRTRQTNDGADESTVGRISSEDTGKVPRKEPPRTIQINDGTDKP